MNLFFDHFLNKIKFSLKITHFTAKNTLNFIQIIIATLLKALCVIFETICTCQILFKSLGMFIRVEIDKFEFLDF
jgi:hypothetical protein